jgi:small-conductance mechanosensitive channel
VVVALTFALQEAGIHIPFPQRDVHLLREGESEPETVSGSNGSESGDDSA